MQLSSLAQQILSALAQEHAAGGSHHDFVALATHLGQPPLRVHDELLRLQRAGLVQVCSPQGAGGVHFTPDGSPRRGRRRPAAPVRAPQRPAGQRLRFRMTY